MWPLATDDALTSCVLQGVELDLAQICSLTPERSECQNITRGSIWPKWLMRSGSPFSFRVAIVSFLGA
ncbi:hypothetical protein SynROS8604_00132 [Synechococcus sp. ROS8604]|nr:hypothetical protein SynROS8604_00132 [Synechococcus sp. ROS8604]